MEDDQSQSFVGKIYKLVCEDGHYYIGSTKTELKCRLYAHKTSAIRFPDRKVYKYINDYGWDKTKIECIKQVECKQRSDMLSIEDMYIRENILDPLCLNENIVILKEEELKLKRAEYYKINAKEVAAYKAQYRQKNAERIAEYNKKYVEEHEEECKAARKKYYEENKEEILKDCKEYREENKNRIAEYKKKWAEQNKEHVQAKMREYTEAHREGLNEKGKQYYKENRDIIKEKEKLRRSQNRQKYSERQKKYAAARKHITHEKHDCVCGGKYITHHKKRHEASKKHQKYVAVPSSA